MAEVSIDYINPFLESAITIVKGVCQTELKVGKPYLRKNEFNSDSVIIMIGVTGEIRGQVMLNISENNAKTIASKMMMGMPVNELDEMSLSAISELGNMIMGNASTIFSTKEIGIDITPPTLGRGNIVFDHLYTQNICVPLLDNNEALIEINLAIKKV